MSEHKIIYDDYKAREATELLHILFYGRNDTDNIGISRIISHAFYQRPFTLQFNKTGVYAVISDDAWLIYHGSYDMKFRGDDV